MNNIVHVFVLLEMYPQGRFLEVGLLSRKVNARVLLLGITSISLQKVCAICVLTRDAKTDF